ncbi:hypothetical protein [Flavobacterium sp. HSC-61S13]|uniref:hypothetical protein n=1 Tax=Flavobacterium sp. HSC-61S13 TaxID=2910963 RepID=UPI00209D947F|nr:hypothetical protein [Flavobacterium sp. HSC-61S13]MCP1994312.1 hypothetical protein [Flavobacterium sp. HSC-61S13]
MKKRLFLITAAALFATSMVTAKAKIPVCFPCETIETVQELPTDSEIQKLMGQKVNLSYLNTEYGVLGMSVWNSNGRFVLSDISNNTYFEIDAPTATILKEKHGFDIETAADPLTFWKKTGGKLVLGLIVVLIIWGSIPSKKKDDSIKPTNI